MLTLSKLKYDLKSILRILSLIIGVVIFIFVLFKIGSFVKEVISPTPPASPDVKFGILPELAFPKSVTGKIPTYRIDTLSGRLPTFYHLAKVYTMERPKADLLALDRANNRAKAIGFNKPGRKTADKLYEWKNDAGRTFSLNLLTSDFLLKSDLSTDSAGFIDESSETEAINKATSFLNNLDLLRDDIDTEKTTTYLYSFKNESLVDATSLSNTQAIKVYFFQKDVEDLPVYYPDGRSTMSVLITSDKRRMDISGAEFFYQTPDLNRKTTYSIKTSTEAFEEWKKGKAYIASHNPLDLEILIKNLYLGYYIGQEKQDYLMPIYVFEGNNFLAYVSAIRDEWISN